MVKYYWALKGLPLWNTQTKVRASPFPSEETKKRRQEEKRRIFGSIPGIRRLKKEEVQKNPEGSPVLFIKGRKKSLPRGFDVWGWDAYLLIQDSHPPKGEGKGKSLRGG